MILIKKISFFFLFPIVIGLALDSLIVNHISSYYFIEHLENKPFNAINLIPETENHDDEININNALNLVGDKPYLSNTVSVNFPYFIRYIPAVWQPPKIS